MPKEKAAVEEAPAAAPAAKTRKNMDVTTQIVMPPKPAETVDLKVRNILVSLHNRQIEVSLWNEANPSLAKTVVLQDGTSRAGDINGATVVETEDGFEDLADEAKTFVRAVMAAIKAHGLA